MKLEQFYEVKAIVSYNISILKIKYYFNDFFEGLF